jgi:hypothetical protein
MPGVQAVSTDERVRRRRRLADTMDNAHRVLDMVHEHLAIYGVEDKERTAWDRGYASGMAEGKEAGFHLGQLELINSNRAVRALIWLQQRLAPGTRRTRPSAEGTGECASV